MVKRIFILALVIFIQVIGYSQTNTLFDEIQLMDQYRIKQLIGNTKDSLLVRDYSFMIRSASAFQNLQNIAPLNKKRIYISSFLFSDNRVNNSFLPISTNDGNLAPSKGLQERVSIGFNVRWRALDINIQPEYVRGENLPQEVFKGNTLDNNWWTRYFYHIENNIDDYRRFGTKPINQLFLGQTRIGLSYDQFAVGVSNENIWWGPGRRNSLVFTNNAPGFEHAYLQTNKPIKTPIGNFEFKAILGQLENVDDVHPDDSIMRTIWAGAIEPKIMSKRNIQAITINWNPKWMSNLYIGYAYSSQNYKEDSLFYTGKLDKKNNKMELGAIMLRYVMPKDNAEFYAEIGQPNQSPWPQNFFTDSVKTGFVIGARKLFLNSKKTSFFDLTVEVAQLQLMDPRQVFPAGSPFGVPKYTSWYISPSIRQGYTNKGQILGASVGSGGNSQFVSLSWNKGYNRIGLFFERLVHNSDFYHYAYITGLLGYSRADAYWVDLNGGVELQFMPYKHILVGGSLTNTNAMNYRWTKNVNDISVDKFAEPGIDSDKYNVQINFSIKFLFNGTR